MNLRKLVGATVLAGSLAVGLGAAPANAGEGSGQVASEPRGTGTLSAEDAAYLAGRDEFHCTLTIQYPHASHHKDGTINVVGDVTCPVTMREMYLRVFLEKSGGGSWPGTPQDVFYVSHLKGNAATSCGNGPGTFRGMSTTIVYPPPGWSPPSQSWTTTSSWISLVCGAIPLEHGEPEDVTFDIPFFRDSSAR